MQKLMAWMNGERVGVLTRQRNGAHEFEYDAGWLRSPLARPLSLSMPLQVRPITSAAVINFFDNLLPDSPAIRDRIVARYQIKSRQPFDLLQEVGRDSVGATMLLPPEMPLPPLQARYEVLDEARLEKVLSAYQSDIPLGMLREETDFRISVAGAQEKTALLLTDEGWSIPAGATPTSTSSSCPSGRLSSLPPPWICAKAWRMSISVWRWPGRWEWRCHRRPLSAPGRCGRWRWSGLTGAGPAIRPG